MFSPTRFSSPAATLIRSRYTLHCQAWSPPWQVHQNILRNRIKAVMPGSRYQSIAGRSKVPVQSSSPIPATAMELDYSPPDPGARFPHYAYRRLQEKEVRILELFPGEFDSDVRLILHTRPFRYSSWPDSDLSPSSLAYEAVSYAWGDPKDTVPVYVLERGQKYSLPVTRNCEEALRYLRLPDIPRRLWVDAISINQLDLEERASQVRIMSHIYRKASQVNVWLGPASSSSDLAFEWIKKVNQHLHIDPTYNHIAASNQEGRSWLDNHSLVATAQEKLGFRNVVHRPYFLRLWIWQEVRFNQNAILMCGRAVLPWSQLRTAVEYAMISPSRMIVDNSAEPLLSIRDLLHQRFSLLHDLHRMSRCSCTDERDRIFSAQVFEDHWTDLAIMPDYKASVAEVFTRAMKRFIQVRRDLNFFAYVGGQVPVEQHRPPTKDLPSWVPDWSQRHLDPISFRHRAASSSTASIVATGHKKLVLKGVAAGRIEACVPIDWNIPRLDDTQYVHHALRQALNTLLPASSTREDIAACCRALTCGLFAERHVPSNATSASFEQCRKFVDARADHHAFEADSAELQIVLNSFSPCRGRSLFRTADGRLGLGPRGMQAGDELVVFLGCLTPMVLRARDPGAHAVVGAAYCDGLMDGEALLGPLPADYEELYFHDGTGYVAGYQNRLTGEMSFEDPRLPHLPPAWQLLERDQLSTFPTYENVETGERRRINFIDPRLDADVLEERGVMFGIFTLV